MVGAALVEREDASVASVVFTPAAELKRLGDEIAELAAHVHAATYELLVRLREFDLREGWARSFRSCAHWLSWRTRIAPGAAREKVRAARSLEHLPRVSDAMRRGELSFAKVRAITRVASADNEEALLEVARHGTAAHVEKIVRAWRRVDRLEEQREDSARHDARYLTLRVDEDGRYELRGCLDPEVGALLEKALETAVETLYGRKRVPATGLAGERTAAEQRRADAFGLIAERALESGMSSGSEGAATIARADRYQVVLHVDRDVLRSDSDTGQSVLANGARVSAETSRRLSCDASVVVMSSDPHGNPEHSERRTRTVPAAIRRALDYRDRGCRFPGCTSRFCDAHHVVHWADGGATRLDNLVLLCRTHHRLVHEGGYCVELNPAGEIRVLLPGGRVLPIVPPAPVLPADPVASLRAARIHTGVVLDASTTTPKWNGEHLDLDFAILTLRRR